MEKRSGGNAEPTNRARAAYASAKGLARLA